MHTFVENSIFSSGWGWGAESTRLIPPQPQYLSTFQKLGGKTLLLLSMERTVKYQLQLHDRWQGLRCPSSYAPRYALYRPAVYEVSLFFQP